MTMKNGYAWFLPSEVTEDWYPKMLELNYGQPSNETNTLSLCSKSIEAVNQFLHGTFSLVYEFVQRENGTIDFTNETVDSWEAWYDELIENETDDRQIFELEKTKNKAKYTYDGVLTIVNAYTELLNENPYAYIPFNNKDIAKFLQKIEETNFTGVTGDVFFVTGGTRVLPIKLIQHLDSGNVDISFHNPLIDDSKKVTWDVNFNRSSITWLNGDVIWDGTPSCLFNIISDALGVSCVAAALIGSGLLSIFLITVISATIYYVWQKRYAIITRKLNEQIEESEKFNKYMKTLGLDLISPSKLPENALEIWEIPKTHIVINRKLGEGAFGTVFGGEALLGENKTWKAVAVKTLKANSSTDDRLDFLAEAEAMKRFNHTNIIKLLAVCVKQGEPIYTIMEFMLYGDLKTYLLARRHLVTAKITDDSDFSPKRLTAMALDVARAIAYLSEKKFVHRDIACRNCLVSEQRTVKLGDFGMARPTFENDYYRFSRKGMLPVRWMAPESLALGLFTPASDVWAFGVLLYEMITFGSFPYQGLSNSEVLDYVKSGNILDIPKGIKPQLESLMKSCWRPQPIQRPSAKLITEFISNYPRLMSPVLDLPCASIEMNETNSKDLELLPNLRQRSISSELDTLSKPMNLNNLDSNHTYQNTNPSYIHMENLNVRPSAMDDDANAQTNSSSDSTDSSTPDNQREPLIYQNTEISRSSPSVQRYVPTYKYLDKRNESATPERNYYVGTSSM